MGRLVNTHPSRDSVYGETGGGGGGPMQALDVLNTDNINGSGAAFYVGLGTTGMAGPATYSSATGHVRVTVQVTVRPSASGDFVQAQIARDSPANLLGVFAEETASGAEDQSAYFNLTFKDTVPPGEPHSWGVNIHAGNPGGSDTWQINAGAGGQIMISLEDIP